MELFYFILWVLSCAALGFVIWNILGWPTVQLPPKIPPESAAETSTAGTVSILIPCRDEEHNLPTLLDSLRCQGTQVEEILVLDDESSDGTAALVRRYSLRDSRIRLVSGRPRPEGWFGKTWACEQLSREAKGDWLLYLDADVQLEPGAVPQMLREVIRRRLTFLSCWPRFESISLGEKLAIPLLNFATFTSFPMAIMKHTQHHGMIVASGACLLMERNAYDRVGGHASCAGGLLEDHALARAWRRHGERSLTLDGQHLLSVRMYRDIHELANGFRKNLYKVLRTGSCFWAFMSVQTVLFTLPLYLALVESTAGNAAVSALLHIWMATANVVLIRLLLAAAYGMRLWPALLHHLVMPGMLWVALMSFWSIAMGGGVKWKGRTYFSGPASSGAQQIRRRLGLKVR